MPAPRRRGPGPELLFQRQVLSLAGLGGWLAYHPPDNRAFADGRGRTRRQTVTPGFPDLTLVRGPELIFAELKADQGRLSPAQQTWIAWLEQVSQAVERTVGSCDLRDLDQVPVIEVHVWRPADFDQIACRLTGRTWPTERAA